MCAKTRAVEAKVRREMDMKRVREREGEGRRRRVVQ